MYLLRSVYHWSRGGYNTILKKYSVCRHGKCFYIHLGFHVHILSLSLSLIQFAIFTHFWLPFSLYLSSWVPMAGPIVAQWQVEFFNSATQTNQVAVLWAPPPSFPPYLLLSHSFSSTDRTWHLQLLPSIHLTLTLSFAFIYLCHQSFVLPLPVILLENSFKRSAVHIHHESKK